ncbi:uncharacterized protein [Eleutherodactylus coqui]|uniref:uncharacterized protein isoform X1 n=1 Tax=Eleutherodactylus coqui TaxID=57060 RepID=UPI003463730A
MEELMRMIKDVVASQGTSWLVKMAEDLSGTTAAEEGASTSQPVLPSSEEPRGRPTRRRNPPARLSPSPVAKRGGRNSSPRPERLGGNSAVRSQRGREEVEPAERMGVGEPEVAERTTLTRGDIRQGERGSRPGNRMSACGATMSRSPRSRRVPQESGTARYAREYQQTSLPAPNVPLAMPEVNEADVTFQGAAPDGGGRGGMLPCFLVGSDRGELLALVKASVTSTTWNRYNKVWKEWLAAAGGIFPTEERARAVTLDVLSAMRKSGSSADAAKKRLSAIAFLLRLHGTRDVTKDFVFGQIIKGWKKDRVTKDGRRPITFELLNAILNVVESVCTDASEAELFRAAFSIAFFAALRIGELVSACKSKPGGLFFSDVVIDKDCIKIGVRRSKTDIYGMGEWIRVGKLGTKWCPVLLVKEFAKRHCGTGPFLCHASGFPLTKYQFTAVMRNSIRMLGLNPSEFGSHSFRIGAATSAFACGMGIEGVKKVGRWKSDAYRSYVRPNLRVL